MRTVRAIVALPIAALVGGCSLLFAISDDAASGTADARSDTVTDTPTLLDAAMEAAPLACPADKRGAPLVAADRFCIDRTEVSAAEYDVFKAADKAAVPVHPECTNNTSYEPLIAPPASDFPVLVDWCDAYAYCAWAGKRLCGSLGEGAAVTLEAGASLLLNRDRNEWLWACVGGPSARTYPYGLDRRDACAPPQVGSPGELTSYYGIAPVGSRPDCEGGYPGIFDLGGNASEWINAAIVVPRSIDGSITTTTLFYAMGGADECASIDGNLPASDQRHGYGIRCCWSP